MHHEHWTCDGCNRELPEKPITNVVIAAHGGQLTFPFDVCQACMDRVVTTICGDAKRKILETPTESYRPQLPWRPEVFPHQR